MEANYTLRNGKDIYLNESQICTAIAEDDGYTTFAMSNGDVITAIAKDPSAK